MKRFLVVLVLLVGCGSGGAEQEAAPSGPVMHTLSGTIDAQGDCIAAGRGYDIVVTDQDGTTIATAPTETFPDNPDDPDNICESIPFSVEVPEVTFYTLEIGQHEAPTWSKEELVTMDWRAVLLLNVDECDFFYDDCSYLKDSAFGEAPS